jgi:UDP-N-acetylmuramoyl-tripeptide--D-alanyl-D-alanine ligase
MVKNCVFFCLKGKHYNGNQFADVALRNGAAMVVTESKVYSHKRNCLVVEDVLLALQLVAAMHRTQIRVPVIAITGTNGKTTTKELIHSVLSTKYKVFSTQGNLNNHIGVPLTLLNVNPKEAQMLVIEMGANHTGEIATLCKIVAPEYGLITNIGKAHLEGFGLMENIINTKVALYHAIRRKHGSIFVNSSDSLLMSLSTNCDRVTYGLDGNYSGQFQKGSFYLNVTIPKYNQTIHTQLAGNYNFDNLMASYAIGEYFNVDFENIKAALENYKPDNHRSEVIQSNGRLIIVDAYNANPTSMQSAILNLKEIDAQTKVCILGDMFELGDKSIAEHQTVVNLLRSMGMQQIYLLGEHFCATDAPAEWKYDSKEKLTEALRLHLPKDATVLLKGSNGMKMEQFLNILTNEKSC